MDDHSRKNVEKKISVGFTNCLPTLSSIDSGLHLHFGKLVTMTLSRLYGIFSGQPNPQP